ncbi:MAG: SMC family ATPase [Phototrophicaceae bacterium]
MIPVRLELHNFLPYRTPDPIYFEGIHLAALIGQNGAGKSSLLDAITWVLWGKARARRDDDLVHLGQSDMYIQLDFLQEGTTYRVIRKRKTGKRGQGYLDLFIVSDDGELRTINEPSMRGTQIRIDEILRLDYDTFVNSAFLQQGKADAFTTKTPAERKRILSDILGLEQWSTYEDRVKAKLKDLDNTVASIDGALIAIEEDLAKEPQYKRELEASEKAYVIAQEASQDADARLDEVKDVPADLRNAQSQQADINRRMSNFQNDIASVDNEITKRQVTIAQYEQVVTDANAIEQGYQTLQSAREADSELGAKLRDMSDVDKRSNDLQNQLNQARNQLEQEKREYQTTIKEMQRIVAQYDDEELAQVQTDIIALENIEKEREASQKALADLREERSGLLTRQKTLTVEGTDMNERIETLDNSEGASCPLCGQPLDDDHRASILEELNNERDVKREEYREATERIAIITDETKVTQQDIEAFGVQLADLPKLRNRIGALEKQAEDIDAAQARLDETQAALDAIDAILDSDDYAHEIRQQIAIVDAEREAIGYDRSAHDEAQEALKQYKLFEAQYRDLEFARKTLPTEVEALESAQERKRRIESALDDEATGLSKLKQEIDHLTLMKAEFEKRQRELGAAKTAEQQSYGRVIEAKQQLSTLEQQRKRKLAYEERRDDARQQQTIYKELQMAFGKNGIPAMIIEAAIPELETAANELLGRMTDGRMHLAFNTQRAKASGSGTIETLDIDIADELGTRPYEMYSGGEAFRVNFAIRVALSKMLARRAGAHLKTLFIDEGFGTQDDDGRNKLVEAITAIQTEFELIIVITHIDELRDAFPVHIMVEKTSNGSMVSLR